MSDDWKDLPVDQWPPHVRAKLEELQGAMALEYLPPSQLMPNDMNWKSHPTAQRMALRSFQEELERRRASGQKISRWIDTLKWNRRSGRLMDGHMRVVEAMEANEELVPVLVFDVDDDTESLIMLYLDKVGSMYTEDQAMLERLLEMAHVGDENLVALVLGQMATEEEEEPAGPEDIKRADLPAGGLALPMGVKYDYVVLIVKTPMDYTALLEHFGLQRQQCPFTAGIGTGRVIDGSAYLHRIRRELYAAQEEEYGDLVSQALAES